MLIVGVKITIGKYSFDHVASLEIKRTWKQLSATATITLPRALKFGRDQVDKYFKHGDTVKVECGYLPTLRTEFVGYLARIKPGVPVVLECEDESYQLRRTNFTKSWANAKLKDVVDYIASGYKTEVLNATIGPFRINKENACQVLENIKKIGFNSFMRDGKLVVGFPYPDHPVKVKYHFQRNVAESDLTYQTKEDIRIKIKAISRMPTGKSVSVEFGDEGGDMRTLHFYNVPKDQLKDRALAELDKIKIEGFTGSLTGFGIPYAEHGYIAVISDDEYADHVGEYYIDGVTLKLDTSSGLKRVIEIGKRAS